MLPPKWKSPISIWRIFLAAMLFSLLFILQEYIGFSYSPEADKPFPWTMALASTLPSFLLWPLFAPLIFRLSQAFMQGTRLSFSKISSHLIFSILVAFIHRVIATLLLFSVFLVVNGEWYGAWNNHTYSSIFVNILGSLLIFWILVGVFLAYDYYQKFREKQLELIRMENELNNAQLRALKMQLHPHFLFNTLHTISSLIDESTEDAQKMLSQIGFLLRSLLDQDQKQKISLKEEMKYIQSYLDIEQTRFRDRLKIEYDIEKETLQTQVPNLILQPLVENAIKHGFSKRTDCGKIKISGKRFNGQLELIVEDDGRGTRDTKLAFKNGGIGLKNVKNRLAQMYKENYKLELTSNRENGFTARILIPFEQQEKFTTNEKKETGNQ